MGREAEREAIVAAFDRAATASSALLVQGPAGIGKTALIRFATDEARRRGFAVVTARPTRAETQLAFAAFADLLRGIDLTVLGDAEHDAVATALGRRPGEGQPPQTHVLGFALVDLLERQVNAGASVALVVDDVQWLDAATRDVLTFAMRRLPPAGVCLVVGQRTHEPDGDTAPLDVPEASDLTLQPLPRPAVVALLDGVRDTPLPIHVVERIVAAAGGNPLFATELARAVRPAAVRPGEPLPVPTSLAAAVAGHVEACPPDTLRALAAVALLARPSVRQLDQLGLLADLEPAERAGIVTVSAGHIEFTHPLLASAAHDSLTSTERLTLHGRLAATTHGAERCIHLALGTAGPDSAIAGELAAAATAERDRGSTREAAELALLAVAATPPDDPVRWQRRLEAAELLFWAGSSDAAFAEITEVLDDPPDTITRARALLSLARVEYTRSNDGDVVAARLANEALAVADDPELRANAHSVLAGVLYDDFDAAARHADEALRLLRASGTRDPLALSGAIQASATARFIAGEGLDREAYAEAIALEEGLHVPPVDSAFGGLAAMLKYADELDESRTMLEAIVATAGSGSLPFAVGHLTQLHLWSGDWDAAQQSAERHLWLAERTAQDSELYAAQLTLANLAAHRGDVTPAEQLGTRLYADGLADSPLAERNAATLLGFAAVASGDAPTAVRHLSRYDALSEQMHMREPGYCRLLGDYAEALLATGDVARATEVVDRLEERSLHVGRKSGLAIARRTRALLLAADGDGTAIATARDAVAIIAGTPLAYEHARSLHTLGIVARRLKERSVARESLGRALAEFERMGAASLAARARHELERVGGRADGIAGLTPSEASVADLAASGATTRQIADQLFISVKTVEANLTRIYRKLGIANRAQLANAMAERAGSGTP